PISNTSYDLTLAMEDVGGSVYGSWQYNRDLFDRATIGRLNEAYVSTLRALTEDPGRHVAHVLGGGPGAAASIFRATAPSRLAAPRARVDPAMIVDEVAEHLESTITPPPGLAADLTRMDRVLLTGATGYLGAFLLDEVLRRTDAEVLCLVR